MKPSSGARALPVLAALMLAFAPVPTHGQGCTQCRDNTAATSPATQSAYRHAITLMASSAAAFFLVTVLILRRQR